MDGRQGAEPSTGSPRRASATVLFADVVGSTELRSRHGDAVAEGLRRSCDALLRKAVEDHAGTVVKGLGDGVLATFTAAADGVEAAVAVQQAADVHNRRAAAPPLALRVGLSAGDVVLEDGDVFGGPVVEAARLCAAADGGQVLVSEVVRLLARLGAGAVQDRGALSLKGLPAPLRAWAVPWTPLDVVPALAGQPPLPAPLRTGAALGLAGRVLELDAVLRRWKAAEGGRQAVLLSGEPGIGKTRLAQEAARRAHEEGATVLHGHCEDELGAPYLPFAEALGRLVADVPRDALRDLLGDHPEELVRLCPALSEVLPGLPEPLRSDAETERYRLFDAVASWLCATARDRGAVLVVDDLHWAARPTLVLLQHVLRAATDARLLVVGTYRDTDLHRRHPLTGVLADLRRADDVARIALSGLELGAVQQLLREAAGYELDDGGLSLASALRAETDGNPFFVAEILRHLRETGAVRQEDDRWVAARPVAELGIPEGVREVVGRRLDRLSETANAVLSVAAVVGREFDLDTVTGASGVDEDAAVAALDEALGARLVDETAVGRYVFSHALVRSTLYDELSATRRARVHARVARVVEAARPDDVAALAHHYAAASVAGDVDKAVHHSRRAGDRAMEQLAHDHAVEYYAQALELLGVADDARRPELLVRLGEAQRRSGDGRYRGTLLEAAALAQRLDHTPLLVQAALANSRGFWSSAGEVDDERIAVLRAALDAVGDDDCHDRPRLLARLAGELMFTSDRREREALCERAVALARRTGDRLVLADVLSDAAPASYTAWTAHDAARYADELLVLAQDMGDPYRVAVAHVWSVLAGSLVSRDPERQRASSVAATRLADELGQPTLRWIVAANRAMLLQAEGRLSEVEAAATEAFALGEAAGQPDAPTWLAAQLGTVLREHGRLADALPMIEAEYAVRPGLPAWRVYQAAALAETGRLQEATAILGELVGDDGVALSEDLLWLFGVALLAETADRTGGAAAADVLYRLLLPFRDLTVPGGVTCFGSTELYLGLAARCAGRLDDAVDHLDAAVGVHERTSARVYLGISHAEQCTTLLLRGRPGDADRAAAHRTAAEALAASTGAAIISARLAVVPAQDGGVETADATG